MRTFLIVNLMLLGSLGLVANAAENSPAPAAQSPTCMPVELDGQTTTACFGLTQEQVANLGLNQENSAGASNEEALFFHHCELRCILWDHFGRCFRWRRVCW